jgi:hypothetical protein
MQTMKNNMISLFGAAAISIGIGFAAPAGLTAVSSFAFVPEAQAGWYKKAKKAAKKVGRTAKKAGKGIGTSVKRGAKAYIRLNKKALKAEARYIKKFGKGIGRTVKRAVPSCGRISIRGYKKFRKGVKRYSKCLAKRVGPPRRRTARIGRLQR